MSRGGERPLLNTVKLTSTSFRTSFSHGPSRLILSTKVLNKGARTLACSYESAGRAANTTHTDDPAVNALGVECFFFLQINFP